MRRRPVEDSAGGEETEANVDAEIVAVATHKDAHGRGYDQVGWMRSASGRGVMEWRHGRTYKVGKLQHCGHCLGELENLVDWVVSCITYLCSTTQQAYNAN